MSRANNVGKITQFDDLDQSAKDLIDAANRARKNAYCPFSKFPVGAAVAWDDSADTDSGCNVENSSYACCICAERTAAAKGISQGKRLLKAVAVVAEMTNNSDYVSPCGICRQFLLEFGNKVDIYLSKPSRLHEEIYVTSIENFLPLGFKLEITD